MVAWGRDRVTRTAWEFVLAADGRTVGCNGMAIALDEKQQSRFWVHSRTLAQTGGVSLGGLNGRGASAWNLPVYGSRPAAS